MQKPKVLITGASKGIGLAIAQKLASEYSLILHASKEEHLPPLASDQHALCADFGDPAALKDFCKRLKAEHGEHLYAVINNAGITLDNSIIFQPEHDIDLLLAINLKAPIMICKTVMKIFNLKKQGVIINMSSCLAETGNAFQSVYTACKAGLIAFSKSLAKEAAVLDEDHQIRVLCVSPGFIETKMTDTLPQEQKDRYRRLIPANRFGKPEEIAETVSFLLSEKAGYINGTTIHVNGGMV